jgi:serine protease SohB
MEWLAEYGLFLAKAATLVVAVGLATALVAGAARQTRAGRRRATPPEVVPLNREYRRMAAAFESVALPRKAIRARRKADKAERKSRDREERRRLAGGGEGGRRRVFVLDFKGDLRASGVDALREEVTMVLAVAAERDEVIVRLENSGAPSGCI